MSLRSIVRRSLVALCATAAGGAVLLAPQASQAATSGGGVVNGLVFPGDAGFAYAGCEDPDGGTQPHAVVRKIKGSPGGRSTGFDTEAGTGAGPQTAVSSLRDLGDMTIKVWSEAGSSGFAYVWLFPAGSDSAYLGRASMGTAGGWRTATTKDRLFTWTERDAETFAVVEGGTVKTLGLDRAVRELGNGPARVGFGFGCNGEDFSLDSFSAGGRSYNFEGIAVSTTMTVTRSGRDVTLVGRSLGGGVNRGEPLVLQRRVRGRWAAVDASRVTVDEAGVHTAVLRPGATSRFRWSRREVPYAAPGVSRTAVVPVRGTPKLAKQKVTRDADRRGAERVRPEEPSTPQPTDPPTTEPTDPATPDPTEPPTEDPTSPPTEEPTEPEPTVPDPTTPPSAEPTPEPSPEPSPETPVFCEGMTYDDTALWLESEGLEASEIESSIDEDCPTAEELQELAPLLGLELDLDGTPED